MKIYTKTGDGGQTSLFAGPRVRKDHPRIDAYGTVDELNSLLGLARSEPLPLELDQLLASVQQQLLSLGSQLATPGNPRQRMPVVGPEQVERLEHEIDRLDAVLPELRQFILPGGTRAAAALHVARTICRRAERCVVSLAAMPDEQVSPHVLAYLNRLSDLLFMLARAANADSGQPDTTWVKD